MLFPSSPMTKYTSAYRRHEYLHPLLWESLQVSLQLHAQSRCRRSSLIKPRNDQFVIQLSHATYFRSYVYRCVLPLPCTTGTAILINDVDQALTTNSVIYLNKIPSVRSFDEFISGLYPFLLPLLNAVSDKLVVFIVIKQARPWDLKLVTRWKLVFDRLEKWWFSPEYTVTWRWRRLYLPVSAIVSAGSTSLIRIAVFPVLRTRLAGLGWHWQVHRLYIFTDCIFVLTSSDSRDVPKTLVFLPR